MQRPKRLQQIDPWMSVWQGVNDRLYIDMTDAAICVPLTDNSQFVMAVERRAKDEKSILCFPGGAIEAGEDAAEAANREMQEEIGFKAQQLILLGVVQPVIKYVDLNIHIFLGRGLIPSRLSGGDETYDVGHAFVGLDEFTTWIADARIQDATVITALFLARNYLKGEM